ncbi:hypothetical protein Agub_g5863, partial [Astrephomene gubernaculifera]
EVEAYQVPAVADTRVVDVTGCGNAFCGGFLAALFRGGNATRRQPRSSSSNGSGHTCSSSDSNGNGGSSSSCGHSEHYDTGTAAGAAAQQQQQGEEGQEAGAEAAPLLPPAWLQSGELSDAAAWGCVAASFMAEERGVPGSSVRELQPRARERLRHLLPRVQPVQLMVAGSRARRVAKPVARMQAGTSVSSAANRSYRSGVTVSCVRVAPATAPLAIRGLRL